MPPILTACSDVLSLPGAERRSAVRNDSSAESQDTSSPTPASNAGLTGRGAHHTPLPETALIHPDPNGRP